MNSAYQNVSCLFREQYKIISCQLSASFDLNHISYIGIDMRAIKQIPRRKYDAIKDMENTSDLNLTNQGPDKFIIVQAKPTL